MLEYQGRNCATRSATGTSEGVDAAASNDRYGRSFRSAQGTIIPSVLLTQINSDLPGLVTAQVTEALLSRFGIGPVEGTTQAVLVSAERP